MARKEPNHQVHHLQTSHHTHEYLFGFESCLEEATMPIDEVLHRIQGEFIEMPGLRLTASQAQRLWGLDRDVCDALLGALVDAKFLSQTRDGAYVRQDGSIPTRLSGSRRSHLAVA